MVSNSSFIINEAQIQGILSKQRPISALETRDILAKALGFKGLDLFDVAALMTVTDKELLEEIFHAAAEVKKEIYGKRLVIFAPLYISNFCNNECLYCAFRAKNKELQRRALTQPEIAAEVKCLIEQGQKRILLVAGESYTGEGLQYVFDAIDTVYSVKSEHGEIRRVNVNVAPLTLEEFKKLKDAAIGTYQLFQETYHRDTYKEMHVAGKKADYDWRLTAIDRAMEAGIDDIGIGILFGLADPRFDVLALLQHIAHLNDKFGIGPHTISIPRLEPALGSSLASAPPYLVSDDEFCKIIAILRLAIPYTGIILSTRETSDFRRRAFSLGISQISAGSRTNPGGYGDVEKNSSVASQFSLGDHRLLDEVVRDVVEFGFMPSFCTACYRSGRTGEEFMALAKSGKIKNVCTPNALVSFQEYLQYYASPKTLEAGEKLIARELSSLPENQKQLVEKLLAKVRGGEGDVCV
ncbi:MAG: [FeFe] hydrogenase H-cluster radical SAM maturase HydG [Gammaproteobacteria bacterium GWE2_37_16]|nr:MAG: [FeFe] hydrogenase H-cluster radical SAM maturase HydG [Gammaproteobacteria bacterium GWE2_37_16]